jgi:hypothetical protein
MHHDIPFGPFATFLSYIPHLPSLDRTTITREPFQMAAPHSHITPSLRGMRGIDQLIDRHREDDERADGSFCERSAREEAGAANHLEHLFICLPMKSFLRESPQL